MLTTEIRISLLYPNYKFVKLNLKSKFNYQTEIKHQPNSIQLEEKMDMWRI